MTAAAIRNVVITGASTGIGAACAEYLEQKGFRVFASVRTQPDADRIVALGRARLTPLLLDVTDAESIATAARTVETTLAGAGLDGLVNNAGVSVDVPLECVALATLRRQFEVNTIAPVAVTQAFLPLLRRARAVTYGHHPLRLKAPHTAQHPRRPARGRGSRNLSLAVVFVSLPTGRGAGPWP